MGAKAIKLGCILLGFECRCVAYAQWNKRDVIFLMAYFKLFLVKIIKYKDIDIYLPFYHHEELISIDFITDGNFQFIHHFSVFRLMLNTFRSILVAF